MKSNIKTTTATTAPTAIIKFNLTPEQAHSVKRLCWQLGVSKKKLLTAIIDNGLRIMDSGIAEGGDGLDQWVSSECTADMDRLTRRQIMDMQAGGEYAQAVLVARRLA